jgi:hypothetical protein
LCLISVEKSLEFIASSSSIESDIADIVVVALADIGLSSLFCL